MALTSKIYASLPPPLQNLAVSVYGAYRHWMRVGGSYDSHVAEYRERTAFSRAQWDAWQHKALSSVLAHAAKHVPFYRNEWTAEQKASAAAGDLRALPLLGKEPLRHDPRQFVRDDVRVKEHVFHTSGSTGTPIASFMSIDEYRAGRAVREVRSANWAGVSFRERRATFSGRIVVPDSASRGPFHRFNMVEGQVYFSAFHLRPQNAATYVDALWKHDVQWLTGYAVSYFLLAQAILAQKIAVPKLKAVITTSEKLTAEMRDVIQNAFGCRAFEEYGTVENVVFASECREGRMHVSPDVAVLEILRPDGSACAPHETGEVVATSLTRFTQPLIRYRVGDLASWDDRPCSCGLELPVLAEISGRIEDVVIGPDGRAMVRFHGIFVDQPNVHEGQIVQRSLNHLVARVVTTASFGDSDEREIRERIIQRIGAGVDVTIEVVPEIPRTRGGKFKAVVSEMEPRP
jgi:phenylacetate-CoA ligase